jgi:hypothetical protein
MLRFVVLAVVLATLATSAAATTALLPQVQDLTVTGKRPPPLKTCREDDETCIQAVVTELKLRFPKQFAHWCLAKALQPLSDELIVQDLADGQAARFGGFGSTFKENPMAKKVCATDGPK